MESGSFLQDLFLRGCRSKMLHLLYKLEWERLQNKNVALQELCHKH